MSTKSAQHRVLFRFVVLLLCTGTSLAAQTPQNPLAPPPQPAPTPTPSQSPAPQQAPTVRPEIYFRGPADGSVWAQAIPVAFGLRNYGIAPASVNFPSTGHFHILINVEAPPVGTLIPADSLHRHFGLGQIETMLALPPGTYTLRLVLGDHEHKVISADLVSRPITVTVRGRQN